jgi:hypothetical protein
MNKNSGRLVETNSGIRGRTYNHEKFVNNKVIVHVEIEVDDSDKPNKMLCDPTTLKIIGYID